MVQDQLTVWRAPQASRRERRSCQSDGLHAFGSNAGVSTRRARNFRGKVAAEILSPKEEKVRLNARSSTMGVDAFDPSGPVKHNAVTAPKHAAGTQMSKARRACPCACVDALDPNPCRPTAWMRWCLTARENKMVEFDGRECLPQVAFPLQRVGIDHNRLRVDLLASALACSRSRMIASSPTKPTTCRRRSITHGRALPTDSRRVVVPRCGECAVTWLIRGVRVDRDGVRRTRP